MKLSVARSEGVTEGQGSSALLRKELWFFVITSLILGDVYNTDGLVKSKAFKVKGFRVQVLPLLKL